MFERPVFIIAAPRSGSQLLYEQLCGVAQGNWNIGGESHDIFDPVLGHYFSNPCFHSHRATAMDASAERREQIVRRFARQLHAAQYGLHAGSANDTSLAVRVIDKLPKNAFRVEFLNACFPDALFVMLWRDPRANISSLIEAWKNAEQSGRFVTYRELSGRAFKHWCFVLPPGWRGVLHLDLADIAAFQWTSANNTALDDLRAIARERVHVVSYAGLIANPDATLRAICNFIGLPFLAEAVARKGGRLRMSRTVVTPPRADKWEANRDAIERMMPRLNATVRRLEQLG